KAGEYSKPFAFSDPQTKKEGYRFLYLKSRTEPHRASLEKDYAKIKELAEADKLNRVVSEWFEERRKTTYIRIDDEFNTCAELKDWVRESEINNAQAQVKE